MADPLTAIGGIGALASIIDAIGKTISGLQELRGRWQDADFTLVNIVSQLTALRAALSKIQEWAQSHSLETHHQLVMDLEKSISCCKMIIERIDERLPELRPWPDATLTLDRRDRVRLALGTGKMEELQKMLERQTNALTLLLTACNCKTTSEQKSLLEKSSSRKAIQRVKDDSSSLYVHRGSTSLRSTCTDKLSKISREFQFDRELFTSRVYERAVRSSLKRTLEHWKDNTGARKAAGQRSSQSSLRLRISEEVYNVLLFGDTAQLMDGMEGDFVLDDPRLVLTYKNEIEYATVQILEEVYDFISDLIPELDEETVRYLGILFPDTKQLQIPSGDIPPATLNAIYVLCASRRFRSFFLDNVKPDIDCHKALHLLENAQRITGTDYVPTFYDIEVMRSLNGTVQVACTDMERDFRLFNAVSRDAEVGPLDKFQANILVVDLTRYHGGISRHEISGIDETLLESMGHFRSIATSQSFTGNSVLLLWGHPEIFCGKLGSTTSTPSYIHAKYDQGDCPLLHNKGPATETKYIGHTLRAIVEGTM